MTPEELKLLVKVDVSSLENVTGLQEGEILFYDTTTPENKLKKISVDTFNNLSKTAKPLKPTDATPTVEGLYKPTIAGTYANAGGLIAQEGYDTLFFFNGTNWTKSEAKLPENNVKIPKWENLTFPTTGYLQAVYQSIIYELPQGVTAQSTDIPGLSDKWIILNGNDSTFIDISLKYPKSGFYTFSEARDKVPTSMIKKNMRIGFLTDDQTFAIYEYTKDFSPVTNFKNNKFWKRLNAHPSIVTKDSTASFLQKEALNSVKKIKLINSTENNSRIYIESINEINANEVRVTFNNILNQQVGIVVINKNQQFENTVVKFNITQSSVVIGYAFIDTSTFFMVNINFNASVMGLDKSEVADVSFINSSSSSAKTINRLKDLNNDEIANYGYLQVSKKNGEIQYVNRNYKRIVKNSYEVSVATASKETLLISSDEKYFCKNKWVTPQVFIGDTFDAITLFNSFSAPVQDMYELNNGELVIVMKNNGGVTDLDKIGVWISFNKRTEFKQVIKPRTVETIFPVWGVSIILNKVVITEYGSFSNGSRCVYYSENNGDTFTTILDLSTPPASLYPTGDTSQAHIHGACIDIWYNRIWIVTGDGNNSKMIAWTDNKGITWNKIDLLNYDFGDGVAETQQMISCFAMKDCIIFAPDAPKQAILRIVRGRSSTNENILEKSYLLDSQAGITHFPTKYLMANDGILYIAMGYGDQNIPTDPNHRKSFVLATVDGINFYEIWRNKNETKYPRVPLKLYEIGDYLYAEQEDNRNPLDGDVATLSRYKITKPIFR